MSEVSIELINENHLARLVELANNPNISSTSGVPVNCQLDDAKAWLASSTEHKIGVPSTPELHFTIFQKDIIVGCCILKKINYGNQTAELSYWVGEPFWGQGIATHSARCLLNTAFEILKLVRIDAHYLKLNNVASGSILKKLEFTADTNRTDLPVDGRFSCFYGDAWTFMVITKEVFIEPKLNSASASNLETK